MTVFTATKIFLFQVGNLTISSGDDGVHADDNLQVDGGTIDIKKCCEGLGRRTDYFKRR